MGEPQPGKTTFMIMVPPLPAKTQQEGPRLTTYWRASPATHPDPCQGTRFHNAPRPFICITPPAPPPCTARAPAALRASRASHPGLLRLALAPAAPTGLFSSPTPVRLPVLGVRAPRPSLQRQETAPLRRNGCEEFSVARRSPPPPPRPPATPTDLPRPPRTIPVCCEEEGGRAVQAGQLPKSGTRGGARGEELLSTFRIPCP
ncbi:uncharacterized protein LOC134476518 [Cavia porcellus]|uniref:uncharacterized protein LOC134476517 n=1 Tax=Cavia porcellus TaxID=10141 RepID=UPI002FE0B671